MSDQNSNRNAAMGNCLQGNRGSGRGCHDGHDGAQELRRIISEAIGPPLVQYPIDDTMPVKAWVYEKKHSSTNNYKPLRPQDQRKALEVLNRHLPFWDQIAIPQPPVTLPETPARLRPRLYPEAHLPLPPRSSTRRQRREAARPYGSPQKTNTTKFKVVESTGRKKSRNWIQTDGKEEENARMDWMEDDLPVLVVPDLVVTRPGGETRRLPDPNQYVSSE
ncbi:hypothetical protein KVR01_012884 [Diaporthe batatas]|uniref:uncharacterized protein n=1 Tax=Diaporthe batatas TaxID=748121 RepID=UPI001D04F9F1|nr:uncharacterized protein KVR01_012884 [Diaporthe batatas]KAG8157176.1 hypothetical protein KVR01_012884 [Diaporthe batatas]